MSKKYLTLLTGILISGCNSNGTASKVSPQLPQVIKSVASSVNKAKVGAILGTYVCTFHNHKTGVYDGQIPTFINVPGEFKKLQNIPFTGKTLDVTLFMPSEAPDYNKIIKKCEDLNLDPDNDDDVIDGVKISTDLKSSFLYDIYNPNLNVKGKDNFLEELNKRSNVILSENIKSGAQFMRKSNLEDYMNYNFIHRKIPVYISGHNLNQVFLHAGSISDNNFFSDAFLDLNEPKTMYDIGKKINDMLFYIDSDSGFASVQHPRDYKRYSLINHYKMVSDFIAAYDTYDGFEMLNEALNANSMSASQPRLFGNPVAMAYKILYDESNPNLIHVYVMDTIKPVLRYYTDKALKTLELNETYQITIDYILDKSKYKSSFNGLGVNSVAISKVTPIKDFTMTSSSFEKKGVFDPTEDFMRQMVFNNYQNLSSRDYIDEDEKRIRNNDTWVLK